jgi:hypothetical protein
VTTPRLTHLLLLRRPPTLEVAVGPTAAAEMRVLIRAALVIRLHTPLILRPTGQTTPLPMLLPPRHRPLSMVTAARILLTRPTDRTTLRLMKRRNQLLPPMDHTSSDQSEAIRPSRARALSPDLTLNRDQHRDQEATRVHTLRTLNLIGPTTLLPTVLCLSRLQQHPPTLDLALVPLTPLLSLQLLHRHPSLTLRRLVTRAL